MDPMFVAMGRLVASNNTYQKHVLSLAVLFTTVYNKWSTAEYDTDWSKIGGGEWLSIVNTVQSIFLISDTYSHPALPSSSPFFSLTKEQMTYVVCLFVGSRVIGKTHSTHQEMPRTSAFFDFLNVYKNHLVVCIALLFAVLRGMVLHPLVFCVLIVFVYFGQMLWDFVCVCIAFYNYQGVYVVQKCFFYDFLECYYETCHNHPQSSSSNPNPLKSFDLIQLCVSLAMMVEYGHAKHPEILQYLIRQMKKQQQQRKAWVAQEEEEEEEEEEDEGDEKEEAKEKEQKKEEAEETEKLVLILNQHTWIAPQLKALFLLY